MRVDGLTPRSPWQARQLSATKAPLCSLPDATRASVAPVQAIRVGVRSGGCGSPAGPLSAVKPIARQIALQVSSVGPFSWYRPRTTKPRTKKVPTIAAADHQPIRGQGLSSLNGP